MLPVGIYYAARKYRPKPDSIPPVIPGISILSEKPDWSKLKACQNTITRDEFEQLVTRIFTTGEVWRKFISIDEHSARITTTGSETFELHFSTPDIRKAAPRHWKTAADLPPAPAGKPLKGLHIAIDPGHIGGKWAKLEERWLVVGNGTPVCEGDMTLQVAKLLKPQLEDLGAKVSLVRSKPEPVTTLRPETLLELARQTSEPNTSAVTLQKTAERLFYRTAEIHARARLVNESLKPDLVLCLHFNAEAWGDPDKPTLVDRHHFHLLLNGAYGDDEVIFEDQRFSMLEKLLSRTHEEEAIVGTSVAAQFTAETGLPPFLYPPDATNARPVNGNPCLWARNLLANRLYDCPVIFIEPYVMNSTIDHPRMQAGDYQGERKINGKKQVSIFREYAGALARGLAKHYGASRK